MLDAGRRPAMPPSLFHPQFYTLFCLFVLSESDNEQQTYPDFFSARWPEGIHDRQAQDQGQHDAGDQARCRSRRESFSIFCT
jgi:hypothetical protein